MFRRHFWICLAVAALLLGALTAATAVGSAASSHAGTAQSAIATPTLDDAVRHVVRSGETLRLIARRYGVGMRQLATYNGIVNPDRIYPGQVLRIPPKIQPTALPPRLTPASPIPAVCPCEEIAILDPGRGVTVTNPVLVSGFASSPFEQTVVVTVLDGNGDRIGLASGVITGAYGQRGPFSVTVPFTVPANSQPGRIQVFTESPRDGAMEHLSSVTVMLQGIELSGSRRTAAGFQRGRPRFVGPAGRARSRGQSRGIQHRLGTDAGRRRLLVDR